MADFDVLCLQEVADNFQIRAFQPIAGENPSAVLASLLPGYTAIAGAAVTTREGGRRRTFGNLVLGAASRCARRPGTCCRTDRSGEERACRGIAVEA